MCRAGKTSAREVGGTSPRGEKARVCCTPLGGGLGTFKHCFIETQDEPSGSTTYGVHRVRGKGCKYPDDGFDQSRLNDSRTDCGPWNPECKADQCVRQQFGAYPNPSDYQLIRGPNSNSFASTVANACGLTPPAVAGTGQTPGWGDPGRAAKDHQFTCPPVR
jgi:hypothetical protein